MLYRNAREDADGTSMAATLHECDAPASWGSLHENAMYLEERRTPRSTCGSHASLADELPNNFHVVDTASRLSGQPTDTEAEAGELAGTVTISRPIT